LITLNLFYQLITLNKLHREKRDRGDLDLPLYQILYAKEDPHQDRNVSIILYVFFYIVLPYYIFQLNYSCNKHDFKFCYIMRSQLRRLVW